MQSTDSNIKAKIVILGAGESGIGTAILAKKEKFSVLVSDAGIIKENYKKQLIENEFDWEGESHQKVEKLLAEITSEEIESTIVMKSPGIPDKAPIVKRLKEKGIKVLSEIEFASKYTKANIIGITGSNGKTTTATLTFELLKHGNLNVALGGNIGKSFAQLVSEGKFENFVLEISSFQLDDIESFKPHIAVLTNLSPDHLDRYNYEYKNYIESKFKIIQNQTKDDYFIYDADDEEITKWIYSHKIESTMLPFSLEKSFEQGTYIKNKEIVITIDNSTFTMPIASLGIQGQHNLKNAMAASTVAKLLQIRKATIRESLENFQGVEHRLEKVLKINNVQYINDSKATNVNATFYALDSMQTPTVWIVGGTDKGNDYTQLLPLVNEKVKGIICLGVDNEKIKAAFSNIVDTIIETQSMEIAVQIAYKMAERSNTVLLSPACASFDLFENYEDRGRQFKAAVRNL